MISTQTTRDLLKTLLCELITSDGEPDYARYRATDEIEERYKDFHNVLRNAEDDMSMILSLLEKDPHCEDFSPILRLQALVDYVQIAYSIYKTETEMTRGRVFH